MIPVIIGEFSETGFVSITFEIGALEPDEEGDADACGAGASCDGAVTGALEPDEDSPLEVTGAGDGLGVFAAVEVGRNLEHRASQFLVLGLACVCLQAAYLHGA